MAAHGATTLTATEAYLPRQDANGESAASSDKNGFHKLSPATAATTACESSGLPPTTTTVGEAENDAVEEAENDAARDGNGGDRASGGGTASNPADGTLSVTIEERKALELWVDMLGICLLPFCGGGSGGDTSSARRQSDAKDGQVGNSGTSNGHSQSHDPRVGDREEADDPFDSDSDEEEDDVDDHDDAEGKSRGSEGEGKPRPGWVAGWMRRAGVTVAGPLECPLDVRPGGRDEELPCRLAALIACNAKVRGLCGISPSNLRRCPVVVEEMEMKTSSGRKIAKDVRWGRCLTAPPLKTSTFPPCPLPLHPPCFLFAGLQRLSRSQ